MGNIWICIIDFSPSKFSINKRNDTQMEEEEEEAPPKIQNQINWG